MSTGGPHLQLCKHTEKFLAWHFDLESNSDQLSCMKWGVTVSVQSGGKTDHVTNRALHCTPYKLWHYCSASQVVTLPEQLAASKLAFWVPVCNTTIPKITYIFTYSWFRADKSQFGPLQTYTDCVAIVMPCGPVLSQVHEILIGIVHHHCCCTMVCHSGVVELCDCYTFVQARLVESHHACGINFHQCGLHSYLCHSTFTGLHFSAQLARWCVPNGQFACLFTVISGKVTSWWTAVQVVLNQRI